MAAHATVKMTGALLLGCLVANSVFISQGLAQQAAGVVEPMPAGGAAAPMRHLAEMFRYEKALEAGDHKGAELYAYAAWRAAEAELGDSALTGVLAFHYGREVAMSDPALARSPFERADALMKAGYEGPAPALLALYQAYVTFAASGTDEGDARVLRKALLAGEQIKGVRQKDNAAMWLALAKNDLAKERYEEAGNAAAKAEAIYVVFASDDTANMAETFLIRGAAAMLGKNSSIEDVVTAREYFQNGRRFFSPQKSVDAFDPVLANLIGWRAAAEALIKTHHDDFPEVLGKKSDRKPLFQSALDRPESCSIEWAERPAPKFPANARAKQQFGAVVAVFDLATDTAIHNPRILAAAPSETFNKAVLEAIGSWRLAAPPLNHAACRKNIMMEFSFVVED